MPRLAGAGHGRPFHIDQPFQLKNKPLGVRTKLGIFELQRSECLSDEEIKEHLKKEGVIMDFGSVLGEGGFAKVFAAKPITDGPLIGTGTDPLYKTTNNRRIAVKLLDLTVSINSLNITNL